MDSVIEIIKEFIHNSVYWKAILGVLVVVAVYVWLEYIIGYELRKDSKVWIVDIKNQLINWFIFWKARKKADLKSLATGTRIRFYVLPIDGKLHVVSSRTIARINRKRKPKNRITIKIMLEESYYYTK